MIDDETHVDAFLAARFGDDVSDVAHLGAGVWSKAYAFRRAGRDYVIRFGAHQEDFAKDRLAARYACPALPIPRVVEMGKAASGYYAISERVFGGYIDDVNEAQMRALLPALFAALDAPDSPIFQKRPATALGTPPATRPSQAGEPLSWTLPTIGRGPHPRLACAWQLRRWASGRSRRRTGASRRSPALSPKSVT